MNLYPDAQFVSSGIATSVSKNIKKINIKIAPVCGDDVYLLVSYLGLRKILKSQSYLLNICLSVCP